MSESAAQARAPRVDRTVICDTNSMFITTGDLDHFFTRQSTFNESNLRQRPCQFSWPVAGLAIPLFFGVELLLRFNFLRMAQFTMFYCTHREQSTILRDGSNMHIANCDL